MTSVWGLLKRGVLESVRFCIGIVHIFGTDASLLYTAYGVLLVPWGGGGHSPEGQSLMGPKF